jgi:uncharacterized protein (TIGR03435 family)
MRTLALTISLAMCLTLAPLASRQAPAPPEPAFEVASVKRSAPGTGGPLGMIPRVLPPVGGRFTATSVQLKMLVRLAYGVQDFQIEGGPSWLTSERFDIAAKAEDGAAQDMQAMLPMLKTLLADRFKLKVHTETRELPVYALVVARSDGQLGRTMTPSKDDCSNAQAEQQKMLEALAKGGPAALAGFLPKPGENRPCSMQPLLGGTGLGLKASGQPIAVITQLLTQMTARPVHDKTGLSGLYDWEMQFDPQDLIQMMAAQAGVQLPAAVNLPTSDAPSLLTALREELGLRLESERGPVEILVIDGAEMPTPD